MNFFSKLNEKTPNISPFSPEKIKTEEKQQVNNIILASTEFFKKQTKKGLEKLKDFLKTASPETLRQAKRLAVPAMAALFAINVQAQDIKIEKAKDGTNHAYREKSDTTEKRRIMKIKTVKEDLGQVKDQNVSTERPQTQENNNQNNFENKNQNHAIFGEIKGLTDPNGHARFQTNDGKIFLFKDKEALMKGAAIVGDQNISRHPDFSAMEKKSSQQEKVSFTEVIDPDTKEVFKFKSGENSLTQNIRNADGSIKATRYYYFENKEDRDKAAKILKMTNLKTTTAHYNDGTQNN